MNRPETDQPAGANRASRPGRFFAFAALFLAATVVFRVLLVAPPDQRAEAANDGRFATVWEAWQTIGAEGAFTESRIPDAAARAVQHMAIVAQQDPVSLSDRLQTVTAAPPSLVPEGLGDVWRAWRLLRDDGSSVSVELLARAAIAGLGAETDPALRYLSKDEFEAVKDYFAGDTYEGIGAFVVGTPDGPTIDEVFIGEPADRAGLKPGDLILAVGDRSTEGLDLQQVTDAVKGPPGSDVRLRILPAGETEPREVTVTRATVPGPSLRSEVLDGDVGYIWLFRFHRGTAEEFHRRVESQIEQGIRGIVLDMRNNPGGSLDSAVSIASEFLSNGIVMYEISNDGGREDWAVREGGIAAEIPLAVIVNSASASAAEVVAGALQAHDRAQLFGATTYGKGSVQTFRQLSDGSALYLTVARWFTPDGRVIQGNGITPDVQLPSTGPRIDIHLIAAYAQVMQLAERRELDAA